MQYKNNFKMLKKHRNTHTTYVNPILQIYLSKNVNKIHENAKPTCMKLEALYDEMIMYSQFRHFYKDSEVVKYPHSELQG